MTGKTIQTTIKGETKELIKKHVKPGQAAILTLDNGSNKYSVLGDTCIIGADFQLTVIDQKGPEYSVVVENNAGLEMCAPNNELGFLTDGLPLNARNVVISLYDNGGVIDGAVAVREHTPHELTAEEVKDGKIC